MFFHADELRKFWESQDAGAESETDSILAADEEGLGHLHVQVTVPRAVPRNRLPILERGSFMFTAGVALEGNMQHR